MSPDNEIQRTEAEIQWHATAPARGCVGISYRRAGTSVDNRAYFCDLQSGPCVYTFEPQCPITALYHPNNFQRIINIRGREHLFRFYNQIGGVCHWFPLPVCFCNPLVMEGPSVEGHLQDTDCKCETLPDGEKICDPYGCEEEGGHVGLQEDEECKCKTLPTGEKICDPYQCDQEEGRAALQEDEDCKCQTLPDGEKICDPWKCDQGGALNALQQMINPFVQP